MNRILFFLFATTCIYAQQTTKVDFKTLDAGLRIDVPAKKVLGTVKYTFDVLSTTDTIYIDAQNIQFSDVKVNGKKKTGWAATPKQLKLYKGFKKGKNTLELTYTAQPKQTVYFVKDGNDDQIWTQGQGKNTSHWLPSFDDMNEKMVFNISIAFNSNYTVIANGRLIDKAENKDGTTTWSYGMEKPMSSYLAMFAIGKFEKDWRTSFHNTPMELYVRNEDASKIEPTYRFSRQIFDFLEHETGVKYPWGVYRQIPALDFLYGGMENTTATIYSQDFVVDSIGFNDRTYMNVNAHELAHHWFGDMITAENGLHHWLHEGFATYYALLAEQDLYGDDHFYYKLYDIAENIQQGSKNDTIPILSTNASSLSYYEKGAWALHVLREGIGHDNFRKAVKTYLEKYAFKNVNTDQFLAEIKAVAPGYDTDGFKKRWLESGTFEVNEALALINKNAFMQQYLALGESQGRPFAENKELFLQIMKSAAYYPIKEEVLYQVVKVPFADKAELLHLAMQSGDVHVRQAVARTVTSIPKDFTDEYWSLLDDKSYITREIVLNVLYKNVPARRAELLDKANGWVGFNDKNLRILWLTLAYATPGYKEELKPELYAELQDYAGPKYETGVRRNALSNLVYIGKADPVVWTNLVNATLHHKWQFVKYAKDTIRKLLKKEGYRGYFESILPALPDAEKAKLQQLLDEK